MVPKAQEVIGFRMFLALSTSLLCVVRKRPSIGEVFYLVEPFTSQVRKEFFFHRNETFWTTKDKSLPKSSCSLNCVSFPFHSSLSFMSEAVPTAFGENQILLLAELVSLFPFPFFPLYYGCQ